MSTCEPAAMEPPASVPGTALTGRGEGLGRGAPPVDADAGTYPLAPLGDSVSRAGTEADALAVGRYPVTPGCWSSARSPPVSSPGTGAPGSAYSGAKKVGVRGCGTDVSRETSLCTVTSLPLLDDNSTASETRTEWGSTQTTRGQPTAPPRAKPVESTGRSMSMAPTGEERTPNPGTKLMQLRSDGVERAQPTAILVQPPALAGRSAAADREPTPKDRRQRPLAPEVCESGSQARIWDRSVGRDGITHAPPPHRAPPQRNGNRPPE